MIESVDLMNNDRPPAWNMGKVLTTNCESSLGGLIVQMVQLDKRFLAISQQRSGIKPV